MVDKMTSKSVRAVNGCLHVLTQERPRGCIKSPKIKAVSFRNEAHRLFMGILQLWITC